MSIVCVGCRENRDVKYFRILNLDIKQRDEKCNFCIFKPCSKCPIDPNTMRDTQKPLYEFQTKGFDKNKAQLFDSMCISCFKFRETQRKEKKELPRTDHKTYNGVEMRICKGEACDMKYVPLDRFNKMTSNPNTTRRASNYQHRCSDCEKAFKKNKRKYDENYIATEKEYRKKYTESGKRSQVSKERYERCKQKIIAACMRYNKFKYNTDPQFRLRVNLARRIHKLLKQKKTGTLSLTGCTREYLKEYLEGHFKEGMTWENYGSVWHIDHVIPCCAYKLKNEKEQYKCFNYKNLQPLFASENEIKGGKIIPGTIVPVEIVPTPFLKGNAVVDIHDISHATIFPN